MTTRTGLFMIALAFGAVFYTISVNRSLSVQLEESRSRVATAEQLGARAMSALLAGDETPTKLPVPAAETASVATIPPEEVCACEPAAPCAAPEAIVLLPDGSRLRSEREQNDYARTHLSQRVEDAFADEEAGGLSEGDRSAAVELLMDYRELRRLQVAERDAAIDDPTLRGQLFSKQREFNELTGMGVGEFLAVIAEPAPARPVQPGEGSAEHGGDRNRFAGETARLLGIPDPRNPERLEAERPPSIADPAPSMATPKPGE